MTAAAPTAEVDAPPQRIGPVFGCLMLVMLIASLDQTIVSTALPTIVGDLGGASKLAWVVTAYMLASTITTPLAGKLGDLYGRKIVLQVALVTFVVGSALCGQSHNMTELILFRGLQGLGGGALMVSTQAVIGDIVPPRDRGRYSGLIGGVFGVSTVVGPLLGGFFVDNLSWRWIFYVNLPIGIIAFVVLAAVLNVPVTRARHVIDYLGVGLLAAGLASVVMFTSLGGTSYDWSSPLIIGLMAASVVLLASFVWAESRAAEPVLPLALFRNEVFPVASAVGFIVGFAMFGSITYIPVYLQIVKGSSPTESGLQMLPLMAGVLIVVDRQRPDHHAHRPLSPLPDHRHRPDDARHAAALAARGGHHHPGRRPRHVRPGARPGVRHADPCAGGAERRRLQRPGCCHIRRQSLPLDGRVDRDTDLRRHPGEPAGHQPGRRLPASLGDRELERQATPASIAQLPPEIHGPYVAAYVQSLQPVFLVGAGIALIAFGLSWLIREVPLRQTIASSPRVGESFARPSEASSFTELQAQASSLARRENRRIVYERLNRRAGLDLTPQETWLLFRLAEAGSATAAELARLVGRDRERLRGSFRALVERGLVVADSDDPEHAIWTASPAGGLVLDRLGAARREGITELLADWSPELHPDILRMIDELSTSLAEEAPHDAEPEPVAT